MHSLRWIKYSLLAISVFSASAYAINGASGGNGHGGSGGNNDTGYFRVSRHATEPIYQTPGQDFKLYYHGYYQADFMRFHNVLLPDSANYRAGKNVFLITLFKKLNIDLGYDFGGRKVNEIFMFYDWKHLRVDVGHISPIYAFLNTISTPYYSFLELPMIENAFTPSYRMGTQWIYHNDPIAFSLGVYGRRIGYQYTGMRTSGIFNGVYAPINEPRRLLVFNSALWYQGTASDPGSHAATFVAAPLASPRFGFTLIGINPPNTTNFLTATEEVAGMKGSLTMIAGVNRTWVKRLAGNPSPTFGGWFWLMNYFLTGESRVFSLIDGSFVGITPILHEGGAVEISLTADYINLNSQGLVGGRELNCGVSLNWYPAPHTNFRFEYVIARATPAFNGTNQTASIVALRIQTMW